MTTSAIFLYFEGDFLCDAYASAWNDTLISFTNNGGIRAGFAVGNITYEDVLTVQPFDNTVDLVTMSGAGIKASLEAAAASINYTDPSIYPGFGYQLSGLKVTFTVLEDNIGDRVTSLMMKTPEGDYVDVDPETVKPFKYFSSSNNYIYSRSRSTELCCPASWQREAAK